MRRGKSLGSKRSSWILEKLGYKLTQTLYKHFSKKHENPSKLFFPIPPSSFEHQSNANLAKMQAIQRGRLFVPRRPSAAPASAPPPRPKSPSITTHITKNSNDPAHVDLTSHRRGPNPRVPITSTMKLLFSIHEALTCEPFPILIFPTLLVSPPTPLLPRHGHAMNP